MRKNRHMPVFLYATGGASHHRSPGLAGSIAASNVRRQYGQKHRLFAGAPLVGE
jgi:hypothetical protein